MIHPNGVAVDYIWDKLVEAMFSDEAVQTMAEVKRECIYRERCYR